VLHWNVDMLGRQAPVLEEKVVGDSVALVRKVKPLIRLTERETAAFVLLEGIDYILEECPMVEGNTQHKYKEAIALLEESSPGTKNHMYFGFLNRVKERFAEKEEGFELVPCAECGAATSRWDPSAEPTCSFCKTKATALRRKEGSK
jgi:uncharacterized protein (TIGR00269 family)